MAIASVAIAASRWTILSLLGLIKPERLEHAPDTMPQVECQGHHGDRRKRARPARRENR